MTSFVRPRQPFGLLDETRLQTLGSIKNRQNAISVLDSFTSPGKDSLKPATKRRHSPISFEDEYDTENVDPSSSKAKRSKGSDGTPHKPSKFSLVDAAPQSFNTPTNTPNNASLKRKQLSLSVPAPTTKTSIAHSRGSPKHKRVGLLSKQRRFSSSPFKRVDPPAFGMGNIGSGLPFSIDAALSGTISSYKPVQSSLMAPPEEPEKPMPKGWFFEIHEDTPEEEAANLMEHSAATLDISSDDDSNTRRMKDELERGKENIPPPDWVAQSRSARTAATPAVHKGISRKEKVAAAKVFVDAMQEDRAALGALTAVDFYPEGLDENSFEVVDPEHASTSLAEDTATFDFTVTPLSPSEKASELVVEEKAEEHAEIIVHLDSPEKSSA